MGEAEKQIIVPMAEDQKTVVKNGKASALPASRIVASKTKKAPAPKAVTAKKIRTRASIFQSIDELPSDFVSVIRDLEKVLGMPLWLLIQNGGKCGQMDMDTFKGFQRQKDQIGHGAVGLLIESPGGLANCSYYIGRLFQRRSSNFVTIVPQYAKSAATLLAVAGSKIIMSRDAELGPLDVQMYDSEKEKYGSALNTVQSLERLNAAALTAVDQTMTLLAIRTSKRIDSIMPNVFTYVSSLMRPLLEKIDSVDFSEKSRALKMGEEYATRLMKTVYPKIQAERMARQLVEGYPDHAFVIDAQEAQQLVSDHNGSVGLNIELATAETERIFHRLIPYLDSLSVIGRLEEH